MPQFPHFSYSPLGVITSSNCFKNFLNESEYIIPKGKNEWVFTTPIEELEWNPSPKSKPTTSVKHHHNLIMPTPLNHKWGNVKCSKYNY